MEETQEGINAAHEFVKYVLESEKKESFVIIDESQKKRVPLPEFHTEHVFSRKNSVSALTDIDTAGTSDPESEDSLMDTADLTGSNNNTTIVAQDGAAEGCKGGNLALVTAVVTPRFVPSCTPKMLKVSPCS